MPKWSRDRERVRKTEFLGFYLGRDLESEVKSRAQEAGLTVSECARGILENAFYGQPANKVVQNASGGKLPVALLDYLEAATWRVWHETIREHGAAVNGNAELCGPVIWNDAIGKLREWLTENPYHPDAESKIQETMNLLPENVLEAIRRDVAYVEELAKKL